MYINEHLQLYFSILTFTKTRSIMSELGFLCPHRKYLRSYREGTYTPSGVYKRKTTTIVTLYVKT